MKKRLVFFSGYRSGFTLTEVLIVVAILAFILVLILLSFRGQMAKGNDAKRKSDLDRLRIALEDYHNDKSCYLPDTPAGTNILINCDGLQLDPYLKNIPCDPVLKTPYLYVPVIENGCSGYRLCTKLQDLTDPDIVRQKCHPYDGCGWGAGYNYCVTSGVTSTADGEQFGNLAMTPTPNPTPTPTSGFNGTYACEKGNQVGGFVIIPGRCNNYANPETSGCPVSYADSSCNNECGNYLKWCP